MRVELVYFEGCPNITSTRALLIEALVKLGLPVKWNEWNRNDLDCSTEYINYGSPTVLIDGIDIVPLKQEEQGDCCRIYLNEDNKSSNGTPALSTIINAMENATNQLKSTKEHIIRPRWIAFFSAIPSVFIALLPKLTCPISWPAYTALLSSFGINFVNYTPYLPIIMITLLMISLVSIGYRAETRRGYRPLWLAIMGSIGIVLGKLIFDISTLFFISSILLITAAIWNAWPSKNNSCQSKSCCSPKLKLKGEIL
jgi:hypothetical protein